MSTISEIWSIEELYGRFASGRIVKPKIQRRQCWSPDVHNAEYINFIKSTKNAVFPFIFVCRQEWQGKYILLDGNNRLNAIVLHIKAGGELAEIVVPVVIFNDISDEEIISRYEKINKHGVKLDHADILAATSSMITYGPVDAVPLYAEIYSAVAEYYRQGSAREVLPTELVEPYLNQYEMLLGAAIHFKLADRHLLLTVAEELYGTLVCQIPMADFIRRVASTIEFIGTFSAKIYAGRRPFVPDDNMTRIILLSDQPRQVILRAVLFAEIYSTLKVKNSAKRLEYKMANVFCGKPTERRDGRQLTKRVTPISDALLADIVLFAIDERHSPVECKSKRERRAPGRLAQILLFNSYYRHVPLALQTAELDFEHLVPYSALWQAGTKIDINHVGNLTIVDRQLNLARGTQMITVEYSCNYSHYNYPTEEEYSAIIEKRRIVSAKNYDALCVRRLADFIADLLAGFP